VQRPHRRRPGRIDAGAQRQFRAGRDARQGQIGQFRLRRIQHAGAERLVSGRITVKSLRGAAVKGANPAAGEEVLDFGADGLHGGGGRSGGVARQGEQRRLGFAALEPGQTVGCLTQKTVEGRRVQPGFAAAVGHTTAHA
jgi:hypothetical protein